MNKTLLILTLLFASNFVAFSQFKGLISSDFKPIKQAYIYLKGTTNYTAQSDSSGHFIIENIIPGPYQIKVVSKDYFDFTENITIDSNLYYLSINLIDKSTNLDEVVITGTLTEMSVSESPIKIDIISPKLFQKNPSPSLFQAVGMVNGVKPQLNCNVCNTGDIHINGMEGPYTMILIDGMPIVSGLSTVYGLMGIPNSIVDRIEIMKGPGGAIYGSEAMGGIINVITKNTATAPKFYFDHQATSWSEFNTDVSGALKLNKNVNSILSANYFHYDKIIDNNADGFTDITLQKRLSVFNKWSFLHKEKQLLNVAARYVYEDRWGGETMYENKFRGTDSVYGESIYTNRFELISSFIFPVKEKIILQSSYNSHRQNSYYGIHPYIASQQIGFAQLYWDKTINEKQSFLLGIASRHTFYDDNTTVTEILNNDQLIVNHPDVKTIYGLFYQHQIKFNSKHDLLLGGRLDYEKTHGIIPSPRIAYKFSPDKSNQFRLNAGTGFRVVNLFTEDHMALTGAREVVITEKLNPEQSQNINFNYTKTINKNSYYISIDAGSFYTIFTNRIIADYDTDPNLVIYQNLRGKAQTKGLALNVEYTNAWPLKIIAGITYSDVTYERLTAANELETVKQLYAPLWSGNYLVSYTFSKLRFSIDYTGNWYGPQRLPVLPNDYRPEFSPWFTVMNIQFKKMFKGFEAYAGIKNILNFVPENPIMRPNDPFDKNINDPVNNPNNYTFDPSYNYASLQGINFYLGLRISLR
jgi:outer membrane receptor for ferrienterochelin and colicins